MPVVPVFPKAFEISTALITGPSIPPNFQSLPVNPFTFNEYIYVPATTLSIICIEYGLFSLINELSNCT